MRVKHKSISNRAKERRKSHKKLSLPAIALILLIFVATMLISIASIYWFFGGGQDKILYVDPLIVDLESNQTIKIDSTVVTPVIYNNIPDLNSLPVETKKERFVEIFLPAILIAKFELSQDLKKVDLIDEKLYPTRYDTEYLEEMKRKYKTSDLATLRARLNTHPTSIVLAQAALESGWGTSRIFREANNVFGVWSFNKKEPRIRAYNEPEGGRIYLRKYSSVTESIEDYFRTIGTSRSFKRFRDTRLVNDDPLKLVTHLKLYSEQREQYTKKLQNVIKTNNFERFDNYELNSSYLKLKALH